MRADLAVVGSGFFGLTIAQRAAEELGIRVLVLEKRAHIGGNSYSYFDEETGIEVHKYGTHIFHTNNQQIWDYINRFSKFNQYEHKVWSTYDGRLFSMPVNLQTLAQLYERTFTPSEARAKIIEATSGLAGEVSNLEDKAISLIGRELYEALIHGYTKKQWGIEPKLLPKEIITRLPVRYNLDNRYFSDRYQGMPLLGYGKTLETMIASSKIEIQTEVDFFDLKKDLVGNIPVVYTGAIDQYFDFEYGELGWRSLRFESEVVDVEDFQGTSVVNYPDINVPFTRIHEFRHLHPERDYTSEKTFICREFPIAADANHEPYYPMNLEMDRAKLDLYRAAQSRELGVWFGGRLGSYKYLDMHMAIGSALTMFDNEILPYFKKP